MMVHNDGLTTLFEGSIYQQTNANTNTKQAVEHIAVEKRCPNSEDSQNSEPQGHKADVTLKGDTNLLNAPQNQHHKTYIVIRTKCIQSLIYYFNKSQHIICTY